MWNSSKGNHSALSFPFRRAIQENGTKLNCLHQMAGPSYARLRKNGTHKGNPMVFCPPLLFCYPSNDRTCNHFPGLEALECRLWAGSAGSLTRMMASLYCMNPTEFWLLNLLLNGELILLQISNLAWRSRVFKIYILLLNLYTIYKWSK